MEIAPVSWKLLCALTGNRTGQYLKKFRREMLSQFAQSFPWLQNTSGVRGRRSWSRHCPTNLKVAGLISDDNLLEYFIDIILPTGRGVHWALTELSNKNIYWGSKGGRCVGLTASPPSCENCLYFGEPQIPGTFRACPGLWWDCLTFWRWNYFFFKF